MTSPPVTPPAASFTWAFKLDFLNELSAAEWAMNHKDRQQLRPVILRLAEVLQQLPDIGSFEEFLDRLQRRVILSARYPPSERDIEAAEQRGADPYNKQSLSLVQTMDELVRLIDLGAGPHDRYAFLGDLPAADTDEFIAAAHAAWRSANLTERLIGVITFSAGLLLGTPDQDSAGETLADGRTPEGVFIELLRHVLPTTRLGDYVPCRLCGRPKE